MYAFDTEFEKNNGVLELGMVGGLIDEAYMKALETWDPTSITLPRPVQAINFKKKETLHVATIYTRGRPPRVIPFKHGTTEIKSQDELVRFLRQFLVGKDNLSLVAHAGEGDKAEMTKSKLTGLNAYFQKPAFVDTQELYRAAHDCSINTVTPGLVAVFAEVVGKDKKWVERNHNPHCAGNDAFMTFYIFLYKLKLARMKMNQK